MLGVPLKETVANLLHAAGRTFRVDGSGRCDFLMRDKDGRRVALVVRDQEPPGYAFARLQERLKGFRDADAVWLITPEEPAKRTARLFTALFGEWPGTPRWLDINAFAQACGMQTDDLLAPAAQAKLQLDAFTARVGRYAEDLIGPAPRGTKPPAAPSDAALDTYKLLSRQFSYRTVAELVAAQTPVAEQLAIGGCVDAIVVLSDLKNFSRLARAARPEDLNETMSEYYQRARELVWSHGGTLDKFIGDAVLAVFNYPLRKVSAPLDAVRFAADLVALGRRLLSELGERFDEQIETGTRVGLTTGDLWVLNLSKSDIEVSFVGDKINLAARLEKACVTDGALLSNRLYSALNALDAKPAIAAERLELPPSELKGQSATVLAWQLAPETLGELAAPMADGIATLAEPPNAVH